MPAVTEVFVSAVVEGPADEAVVRGLLRYIGASHGGTYGKKGKFHLSQKIRAYNKAARFAPWFVLGDLNIDAACAPPLRRTWLPQASRYLHTHPGSSSSLMEAACLGAPKSPPGAPKA
jgi:hypothetical protein